jgi:hypothetical protein
VKTAVVGYHAGKLESGDGGCWDSGFPFESAGASGDRRCAAGSTRDTQDRCLTVVLDLRPEVFRIVPKNVARLSAADGFDRRHLLGKPGLHLIQGFAASAEAGIDEVDRLAIEAVQAGAKEEKEPRPLSVSLMAGVTVRNPSGFNTADRSIVAVAKLPSNGPQYINPPC